MAKLNPISNRAIVRIHNLAPSGTLHAATKNPLYLYGTVEGEGITVHGQELPDQCLVFWSAAHTLHRIPGDEERAVVHGDSLLGTWGRLEGGTGCSVLGDRVMIETGYFCNGFTLSNTPPRVAHGALLQEAPLGRYARLLQVSEGVPLPLRTELKSGLNMPVLVEHDEHRAGWHGTAKERAKQAPLGHVSLDLGGMNVIIMRSRWVEALLPDFPGFGECA